VTYSPPRSPIKPGLTTPKLARDRSSARVVWTPSTLLATATLEVDFAVNDEELAAGLYAIAAPVRNEARDVVVAVNLAAHASMISLEELVDAIGPHLVSTADSIPARLGYRRDDEQAP
jgi:DNA-binding IclR family transcriptional regulator